MSMKTLSVVSTVASVVAVVGLLLGRGLFSPAPAVIFVQALAAALMIWARLTFGARSFHFAANPTEGGLVTHGPYRYLRHPIYAAVIIFAAAGIAAHLCILNGFWGLLLAAGMVTRALCEERLLRVRYPEYEEYARHTWRMIPFVF
jgi:protein-S-isoprenylcysteine O-methyltransferase Ste14